MGCGTSSHPSKRDTRLQSRVTVAAQQRAEAAYRRQRMAQERAEQTVVWRAEMEVERARILKEMSGGGSRRPSYCQELEDLQEEAPEVREHLDDSLQDYTVKTKNHRNSLPVNGYPRSTVITERRGSRDERERQTYRQQKARGNDENGNVNRRLSTGEKIDLDFLRIIANRSTQTSPSNVRIEEHEQDGDESKNVNQTLELDVGVAEALKGSEETRSEESKKSEDKSITENIDVSQDHMSDKPVNSYNDATSSDNEDVSTTHEHSMTVDDNGNKTVHDSKRPSNVKIENSSEGLEGTQQIKDANSFNHDGDKNTAEVSGDLNEERSKNVDTKETVREEPNQQVQQEIAEKQEHDKQQNGLLEYKEMEQKRDEDKEHGEEQIPNKGQNREKQHQPDEQQDHHQQQQYEKKTTKELLKTSTVHQMR